MAATILVVDDDPAISEMLTIVLESKVSSHRGDGRQ